jgi:tight adherence protein C
MTPPYQGLYLGAVLGLGLVLVLRRPAVGDRLGPYLRDIDNASAFTTAASSKSPLAALAQLFEPPLRSGARRLEHLLGATTSVRRRLGRAGLDRTVEEFRIEQLLWGAAAFGMAFLLSLLALSSGAGSPVGLVLLCCIAAVLGVLSRDTYLTAQVRRRERRLLAELPTVAELLALAVAAGEGPAAALDRIGRSCRGELSSELRRVLADTRTGDPLVRSLDRLAERTGLIALARFADGLAIALERGTPLADVLRAQAGDIREASRRDLIESGARREIAMMIPVVFLVMPVTVVFAFYPGVIGIQMIAGGG